MFVVESPTNWGHISCGCLPILLYSHPQILLWISVNSPVFEHSCETRCLTPEAVVYGSIESVRLVSTLWTDCDHAVCLCCVVFSFLQYVGGNVCRNSLQLFPLHPRLPHPHETSGCLNKHLSFYFSCPAPAPLPCCLPCKCRWKTFSFDLPFLYYFSSSQGCCIDDIIHCFTQV